jgi:hypothetical protein
MPAVLANSFAMYFGFYPPTAKERYQQARDGEEYPQQQINQPAEQKPVKHAVVLVLHDGYRLNIHVMAAAFVTGHIGYSFGANHAIMLYYTIP